jgi:purine-binding chemotaxis protein CheW
MLPAAPDAFPEEADAPAPHRIVLFEAGGHWFGISLDRVLEIVPALPYTPLPGSAEHVAGLVNLRGRIVTVIDLAMRLRLPAASTSPDHSIVIVEHAGKAVGIAVGEIARMIETDELALREPADTLRSLHLERCYFQGLGEVDERVYTVIDPEALLAALLA